MKKRRIRLVQVTKPTGDIEYFLEQKDFIWWTPIMNFNPITGEPSIRKFSSVEEAEEYYNKYLKPEEKEIIVDDL